MNLIALISAILFIPSAFGIVQYPYLYPLGDVEAIMSNTGVGLRKSRGGVAYNPASIARLEGADLSASANTYNVMDSNTNTAEGLKSFKTLAALPNMVFSGKGFDWGYLAFSIVIPTTLNVSTRYEILPPDQSTIGNLIFNDSTEEILVGFTGGIPLNDKWSIGLGWYVNYFGEDSTEGLILLSNLEDIEGSKNRQVSNSVWSFEFVTGVHHSPWEWFNWGLRIRFPNIKLKGSGHIFDETLLTGPDLPSPPREYEVVNEDYDTDYKVPWDFILGLNFRLAEKHRLLLDVGFQLETDFYKFPGYEEYHIKTRDQVRANLGYWWRLTKKWSLLGGIKWNPSPKVENPMPSALPPINFFGGSLGVYNEGEVTSTGIGLYYYKSRTDYKVFGATEDPSSVVLWGIILSSGIKF